MAVLHTKEGREHAAAHKKNPDKVDPPPPVRSNKGKGEPMPRDKMKWLDEDDNVIPFYKGKDKNGNPITNVTYDHDPSMADRYNKEPNGGHNQTKEQRADDFNDVSQLKPMSRADNSSKGSLNSDGQRETYTPKKGPNFTN